MATKKKKPAKRPAAKRAPAKRPPARRQPETLRLRSIAPSLTTTDLQRSIAFYRDVLGFIIGDEWRDKGFLLGVEHPFLPPLVTDNEAQHIAVERDAALQIGGGERRRDAAEPQRLGLTARRGSFRGRPLRRRSLGGLLLFRGHTVSLRYAG